MSSRRYCRLRPDELLGKCRLAAICRRASPGVSSDEATWAKTSSILAIKRCLKASMSSMALRTTKRRSAGEVQRWGTVEVHRYLVMSSRSATCLLQCVEKASDVGGMITQKRSTHVARLDTPQIIIGKTAMHDLKISGGSSIHPSSPIGSTSDRIASARLRSAELPVTFSISKSISYLSW